MDNKTLKSRRDFFKKVLNGTLPFLGFFYFSQYSLKFIGK